MSFIIDNPEFQDVKSLADCTLIVPTVAIGNISQLAIDVFLVNNPDYKYIGFWYDPNNVVPFAANDALAVKEYDMTGNCTSGIVFYYNSVTRTVLVQQRTAILPKRTIPFVNIFITWIKSVGFSKVLLLTSSPSHKREDEELRSQDVFQFFTVEPSYQLPLSLDTDAMSDTTALNAEDPVFDTPMVPEPHALAQPLAAEALQLQWKVTVPREDMYRLAKRGKYGPYGPRRGYGDDDMSAVKPDSKNDTDKPKKEMGPVYFPLYVTGGGMTHAFARACRRAEIPLVGLVALVYKGDNRSVSMDMAKRITQYITKTAPNSQTTQLKEPLSWRYLYGVDHDALVYE